MSAKSLRDARFGVGSSPAWQVPEKDGRRVPAARIHLFPANGGKSLCRRYTNDGIYRDIPAGKIYCKTCLDAYRKIIGDSTYQPPGVVIK